MAVKCTLWPLVCVVAVLLTSLSACLLLSSSDGGPGLSALEMLAGERSFIRAALRKVARPSALSYGSHAEGNSTYGPNSEQSNSVIESANGQRGAEGDDSEDEYDLLTTYEKKDLCNDAVRRGKILLRLMQNPENAPGSAYTVFSDLAD
ncbi:hypothetical protein B0A48_04613 [Cryoendolithus antarcticus]|uniref:Uncharacterized protein n=1 Tax=Cryoendolithus antarcticus TaxID=1507870 RepID=A0A1V8TFW1_9PEZI|nr:hypothetical protein B0A48_04613 [Cryoendolithus antarcticus]